MAFLRLSPRSSLKEEDDLAGQGPLFWQMLTSTLRSFSGLALGAKTKTESKLSSARLSASIHIFFLSILS